MIKTFGLKNGKLVRGTDKIKTKPRWIHIDNATTEDFKKISEFGISRNDFRQAIDRGQRSRIATREGYNMVLMNIPDNKSDEMLTIGLFLKGKTLISIHEKTCKMVTNIVNSSDALPTSDHTIFIRLVEELNEVFYKRAEEIEDEIDKIEARIHKNSSKDLIKDFFKVRKKLIYLNKALTGNKEVISHLALHPEAFNFNKLEKFEIAEIHTDLIQVSDSIKIYREIISNAIEIYNSKVSNQINHIMKRLTIIGSFILLPTLIASIYGMNFKVDAGIWNMPELYWEYGYLFSLGLMAGSVFLTFLYFKRKKWL